MDREASEPPRIFVAANFVMACCWFVDRLPEPGETRIASSLGMEPGGKGLNVAVGTRRLGANVDALIGIGRDTAGQQLRALLQSEGISSGHVHDLAAQSGYGAGFIGAGGQNAIAVFPGANLLLTAQHADAAEADIARADLVYGQFETSIDAVTRTFELAKMHGVRTVLNPSPWRAISPRLLQATSVIIVNEVEAAGLLDLPAGALAGLDAQEVARRLPDLLEGLWSQWGIASEPLLVVTLGEHGAAAFRPGHAPVAVPAFAVRAVDTVGAGDAFAAALCMALCRKTGLRAALPEANAAGAMMASRKGVMDALPTASQLAAQLDDFTRSVSGPADLIAPAASLAQMSPIRLPA